MGRGFVGGAFLCLMLSSACATGATAVSGVNPPWLESVIAQIEAQPVANPPASVTRYTYRGGYVYYLPPRCCDIPGKLYDAGGTIICEPDGGITGKGDGRCPDFTAERTDQTVIWRDARTN